MATAAAALGRLTAVLCGGPGAACAAGPRRALHAAVPALAKKSRGRGKANVPKRKWRGLGPSTLPEYASTSQFRREHGLDRHCPVSCFEEALGRPLPKDLVRQLAELEKAEAAAAEGDPAWQVNVAVSLERYQRLFDAPTEEELEWEAFRDKIAVEKSAKLQIEIDHEKKQADLERLRSASDNRMGGAAAAGMGGDEADFTPAPRRTADDEANVRTSLNRTLDQRLYLIAKDASSGAWRMPEAAYGGEVSLREAAEKCLGALVDGSTEVHFVGNFPVMCETRPSADAAAAADGADAAGGTKTFYFRAALVSAGARVYLPADRYKEYAWVTKAELDEYDEGYAEVVRRFMP